MLTNEQGAGFRGQGTGDRKETEPCTPTPDPCPLNPERGFTLIEMLITTSILGIIAVAIFSTFASGLNIYKRVRAYSGVQVDVLFAFEKMERDLRNALNFSGIDFSGDTKEISFAGVIKITNAKREQEVSLGRIFYYVDNTKGILVKEEQDYSHAVSEIRKGKGRSKVLASMQGMNFSYYYFDSATKRYAWKDSWKLEKQKTEDKEQKSEDKKARIPLGVKVEGTFKDGTKNIRLARTVFIPVAGQ